eukprot:2576870-Rhodomonas_salina.1
MGFGGAPKGTDGKKHELSQWDAKTASFPDHRTDMQTMMSSSSSMLKELFSSNTTKREKKPDS